MKDLFCMERFLSDEEVVYQVTNNKKTTEKIGRYLNNKDFIDMEEVIEALSPARRELAYAVIELYKRIQDRNNILITIHNSENIYKVMDRFLKDLQVEECWVIFLNQGAKIIRKERISQGGITSASVDIRVIMSEALKCHATSLILVHNHPSGNCHPSGDDDRLTQSLFQAAKLMNVRMLDHVVYCNDCYYSYADEGRI